MKKWALFLIPLSLVLLQRFPARAQSFLAGTVLSVGDGDTLRVKTETGSLTIRLGCIDAPETQQHPWGSESAVRLKQLLPTGQAVQLRVIDIDRYQRTVAEVFTRSESVNLQMVKEGEAVVYRRYLSGCAANSDLYLQAEQQAKQASLGFWKQPDPIMPWDFRRGIRSLQPAESSSTSPSPANSLTCDPSYPTICIPPAPPDLNCRDIPFKRFTVLPPDPHRFDRDRDGVGCER